MKAISFKTVKLLFVLVLLGSSFSLLADALPGFRTISGVVRDKSSRKKLEQVSVFIPGTGIGTVTNADGFFSIKIADSIQAKTLEVSHIGYFNYRMSIKKEKTEDVSIYLMPNSLLLKEVIIEGAEPLRLVQNAIKKIAVNNSPRANILTGFYRETIKKRRKYINISEAVLNIYKTPYTTKRVSGDRIQIYKGRKLLSPRLQDTLIVKLVGGPNLSIYLDVVKNPDLLLDLSSLFYYRFRMDKSVMINDRLHFVVNFEPQVTLPYALFYGKLYIDQQTLTFSRAELYTCMDDRNKVTQAILKKKPYKLRFKPEKISYLITYKEDNGVSYLNYIRTEFDFRCDWKRKLFSTKYAVVSEMVVTDKQQNEVAKIPWKLAFNEKHSLSDEVNAFYDPNFWEDYNIIEPTESLEKAVNKLKKNR